MRLHILTLLSLTYYTCLANNVLLLVANHKSHMIYMGQLAKALVSDGNDVTAVVGDGMTILPEYRDCGIKWKQYKMASAPMFESADVVDATVAMGLGQTSIWQSIAFFKQLKMAAEHEILQLYADDELMRELLSSSFDMAIVDSTMPSYFILPYNLPYCRAYRRMHLYPK